MPPIQVKVTCKNCSREALADNFKLHYKLKMMVCPDCYSGKTEKKEQAPVSTMNTEEESMKRINRLKEQPDPLRYSWIPRSDQVKYTCSSCEYTFKHDPYRNHPPNCPYCNAKIPKIKAF